MVEVIIYVVGFVLLIAGAISTLSTATAIVVFFLAIGLFASIFTGLYYAFANFLSAIKNGTSNKAVRGIMYTTTILCGVGVLAGMAALTIFIIGLII